MEVGERKPTVDVGLLKANPNDLLLLISGRSSSIRLRGYGQVRHPSLNIYNHFFRFQMTSQRETSQLLN